MSRWWKGLDQLLLSRWHYSDDDDDDDDDGALSAGGSGPPLTRLLWSTTPITASASPLVTGDHSPRGNVGEAGLVNFNRTSLNRPAKTSLNRLI